MITLKDLLLVPNGKAAPCRSCGSAIAPKTPRVVLRYHDRTRKRIAYDRDVTFCVPCGRSAAEGERRAIRDRIEAFLSSLPNPERETGNEGASTPPRAV